jgi:hypothetical protein
MAPIIISFRGVSVSTYANGTMRARIDKINKRWYLVRWDAHGKYFVTITGQNMTVHAAVKNYLDSIQNLQ